MNLIEELNAKNYTVKGLSDEYYHQIYKSIDAYLERYGGMITEDNFIEFSENDLRMEHISFEEFQKLVKLQEEHEIIMEQSPVGRFSNIPGGKQGKQKRMEIKKITDRALIRRLAQEMTYEETKLMPNSSHIDLSRYNDRNYGYLKELGYRGEDDPAIPEIVTGNYRMFAERELISKEVDILLEAWCRMEFFLKKNAENHRVYTTKEGLEIVFENKPISSIRKDLDLPTSFQEKLAEGKKKALEKFSNQNNHNYKSRGMDVENRAEKIEQELLNGTVLTTPQAYEKLHELGFNDGRETASQIARSGYKLYADLSAWERIKKEVLEDCLELYSKIISIDEARDYLLQGDTIINPDPTREVFHEVIRKPMMEKRYQKGKCTKQELEDAIKAVEADKASHQLKLPSALKRSVRDELGTER